MNRVLVLKFGGTSVVDAEALSRVTGIVRAAQDSDALPVVVTSALSGVTDGLLAAVASVVRGDLDLAQDTVDRLVDRHRTVASSLIGSAARAGFERSVAEAGRTIAELLRVARAHPGTRRPLEDEIVSYGERLSSLLLSIALAEQGVPSRWVDARRCIRTDDEPGGAKPLRRPTEACTRDLLGPLLERGRIPVLGGFIASTLRNATTTLGRGGSDHSASLIGSALDAAEIQIWTDVNGFQTADPHVVPGARTIAHLSYGEAAELAYFGARVLHPRTVQPAVEAGIPLRICNSRQPDGNGTVIDARREPSPQGLKAIAHKRGITVVRVTSAGMLGAYGFLRALFEVFDRHHTPVDVVATSEVSVSLTADSPNQLGVIVRELEELGEVHVEHDYDIVCVVGEGLRNTPGIAARVFGALRDINIVLISQGASTTNLTVAVPDARVTDAVTRLHAEFFEARRMSVPGLRRELADGPGANVR